VDAPQRNLYVIFTLSAWEVEEYVAQKPPFLLKRDS